MTGASEPHIWPSISTRLASMDFSICRCRTCGWRPSRGPSGCDWKALLVHAIDINYVQEVPWGPPATNLIIHQIQYSQSILTLNPMDTDGPLYKTTLYLLTVYIFLESLQPAQCCVGFYFVFFSPPNWDMLLFFVFLKNSPIYFSSGICFYSSSASRFWTQR